MAVSITAETPAAIAHLLREHEDGYRQIDGLQRALAEASAASPATVSAAFAAAWRALAFLENELELHIAKEEGPLFPPIKAAMPAGDRLIDEMVAEHDLIRIKRDELRGVIDDLLSGHDDVREDRAALRALLERAGDGELPSTMHLAELQHAAAALCQKIRVHFENEEELVFPLAAELLDLPTLARIATAIEALG